MAPSFCQSFFLCECLHLWIHPTAGTPHHLLIIAGRQQRFGPPELPLGGRLGGASAGAPMRNAQMYLQGIEPAARLQLLALCLAALERQTVLLREHNIR